jgi:PilZ domain-containing protein
MKPLGDRRGRVRLEVVGSLWGTLEVNTQASIINISRGGALIASPVPAPVDSVQTIRLTLKGHEIAVEARVRHVEQTVDDGVDDRMYRVGLEFLQTPAVLVDVIGYVPHPEDL